VTVKHSNSEDNGEVIQTIYIDTHRG